jgi:hypothetical protein
LLSRPELPVTFERKFKMWQYSVSLSRLCLRSLANEVPGATHSLEVMFQGLDAVQVRHTYSRLVLRQASESEVLEIIQRLDEVPFGDTRYIVLGDSILDGWVVCKVVFTAENDRDYTHRPEVLDTGGIGVGPREME